MAHLLETIITISLPQGDKITSRINAKLMPDWEHVFSAHQQASSNPFTVLPLMG